MSKKSCVRGQFGREHNKWVKTLLQSEGQHMTDNDKHNLLNIENLTHPIQMVLSQKQKIFPQFFFPFLKPILSFKDISKNDNPHN